ncbi:MAG: efflux RND transporter periplasmic adaptor subunit [Hylemonella sp.]|uniref:efflux RND transporter periplasmic adaptor subunit n=1 Tax=Hylemonella sp. TaxID=2066020 RepID=UPI0022BBCBE0|nr:efflux RND transporter periplasmic adaptor subunit [Hylemonella sp.]MCZ8251873.1 efflux RND transporter periplasmic adaptor subunit [Hylemonella sp.]
MSELHALRAHRLARAALSLPLLALLAACSPSAPIEEPVRAVKVLTVRSGSLEASQEFSGEVRPRIESRLGFRVAGKLVSREVELGERVKAGQVLARLDPQDYRLAADAAQAQYAAAVTNRDLAAADFKRFKELREQNFISGAELERREANLKAAQAQVDQAQAQLASQRNQGSYTALVADTAGVVTAVEAETGQVVSAGQPVVRLAQDGGRDAVFAVPEDKLGLMRDGSAVDVRVWPGQTLLAGKVREVSASADPVTRTYQVKVGLQGRELPPLGATVTVQPKVKNGDRPQAIKLPTSALRQDGQATAVWVLDPRTMTVSSQPVQIATADGNEAVVAAGLQEGQQVVAAGVHVLSPGQKVMLWREKTAQSLSGPPQTAVGTTSVPVANGK